MNDETIRELIKNLPAILTAAGVIVTAYLSYRTAQQGKANAKAIEVVRNDVNDKMQQFIEVTKTASHAEGVLEGQTATAIESKGTPEDPIHVKVK